MGKNAKPVKDGPPFLVGISYPFFVLLHYTFVKPSSSTANFAPATLFSLNSLLFQLTRATPWPLDSGWGEAQKALWGPPFQQNPSTTSHI
jgi:hypothetical protein